MILDKFASQRLNLIRFPLILGVIFIHNYNTIGIISDKFGILGYYSDDITDFVRYLISQELARTAVPLFFLISGYLFFIDFDGTKEKYFLKLKNRIRTLLIPYIFWNISSLIYVLFLKFSGRGCSDFCNNGVYDCLIEVFGFESKFPLNYPLWFIRDLMVMVLISPVIYYINKFLFLAIPFLLVLAIFWLGDFPHIPGIDAVFYILGAFLAFRGKSLFFTDKYGLVLVTIYLLVIFIDTGLKAYISVYVHKIGIILGMLSMLFCTNFFLFFDDLKNILLHLSKASFFIYAAHIHCLENIRKITYILLKPDSAYFVLLLYFFIPIIVSVFLFILYRVMMKKFPKFTNLIVGGRIN